LPWEGERAGEGRNSLRGRKSRPGKSAAGQNRRHETKQEKGKPGRGLDFNRTKSSQAQQKRKRMAEPAQKNGVAIANDHGAPRAVSTSGRKENLNNNYGKAIHIKEAPQGSQEQNPPESLQRTPTRPMGGQERPGRTVGSQQIKTGSS